MSVSSARGMVVFDTGPLVRGTEFCAPREVIRADRPGDVPAALEAVERARRSGAWLAGYASYELGYALQPRLAPLMPEARDVPLVLFGVFDAPRPAEAAPTSGGGEIRRGDGGLTAEAYGERFARAQDLITAGDIYQVNLTFPLDLVWKGDPQAIYALLQRRQPVDFGAFVDLGGPMVLSRSPELFFRVDAGGQIETRPMKGTAARGATASEDEAARAWLASSEKNRAENLMIVDLLRNDLSRICEVGSVRVPSLYDIETYATVHQMTSHVTGRLQGGVATADIFTALFPCGSVTGAPKIRAMEVIRELEEAPRGVYCGAVGWMAPDGRMEFNVAIRTLVLFADGRARVNVGGGIVHDSRAESEYEEALWKARFITGLATG